MSPKSSREPLTGKLDDYLLRFPEEPGYLDYARVAPVGRTVLEEQNALLSALATARHGSLALLDAQHERMRAAVADLLDCRPDQVAFQPSTSPGLFQALSGLTGGVAFSLAESPAIGYAVNRVADATGAISAHPVATEHGRLTPSELRAGLDAAVTTVVVALVDERTGVLADLDGIRQVIGDRMLIVDATQGAGIVDAPFDLADVVVGGGHTWLRGGPGTGYLALSDRALDRITPSWSGYAAAQGDPYAGEVTDPPSGAAAFEVSPPDPVAAARLAAAVDEALDVGVAALGARVAEHVSRLIDLADEYAVPVLSPRAETERAGIVILAPEPEHVTALAASLHNHGVSATVRDAAVRLSAHATVPEETFAMLRAALLSFSTAI